MTSKAGNLLIAILLVLRSVCGAQTSYKVNTDAKLRSGPGTIYRAIDIAKNGESVRVVEQKIPGWFKVEYKGKIGFISSKLVTALPDSSPPMSSPVSLTSPKSDEDRSLYFVLIVIVLALVLIARQRKKGQTTPVLNSISNEPSHSPDNQKTNNNNRLKKQLPASEKILRPEAQTKTEVNHPGISQLGKIDQSANNILQNLKIEIQTNAGTGSPNDFTPDKVHQGIKSDNLNSRAIKEPNEDEAGKKEIPEKMIADDPGNGNKKNDRLETPEDDSIVNISGDNYNLLVPDQQIPNRVAVLPWNHQYIYSASDINYATKEQKEFYTHFKQRFLEGIYLDLNGNTNYCFILLFDMVDAYLQHKSLALVENQIEKICKYYPATSKYGIPALRNKLEAIGDQHALQRLRLRHNVSIQSAPQTAGYNYSSDPDYWRLGTKFQSKLSLTGNEVSILNAIWSPTNNFFSIDRCGNAIVKLFISVIRLLDEKFRVEQSSFEKEITTAVDVVLRKHFHYKSNSYNYKSSIETVRTEIYTTTFKLCENSVRERYGHKRKLNTDTFITDPEAKTELDSRIIQKVNVALLELVDTIEAPDEVTELELNAQNTARWKSKFDELSTNFNGKPKEFAASVLSLAKKNGRNPAVENLFFEASKFLAKFDKESSLLMYVNYIYHDLNSSSFDNRKLSKTVQKSLFNNNEQLHGFEKLLADLINDRNLQNALNAVPNIYTKKRKKIQLNSEHIKEVQEQHSDTVELLNEYLKDEYEDESNIIKTEQTSVSEIKIDISSKSATEHSSIYITDISFTEEQIELLQIFSKNNFSVLQTDVEAFAKSKSVFKNQLIGRINEICFDRVDDVLIEEEEESFIINPEYYKSLLIS